jgi:diaminopimelate decarboxylase
MSKKSQSETTRRPAFTYHAGLLGRQKTLHCDAVSIERLAKRFGTPLYVYSASMIRDRFSTFDRAFENMPHTVCYSVKANSNLSLLKMLADMGAGFDIVSGGELERVLRANKKAAGRVVFSGVGKTADEIKLALRSDILLFNAESDGELELLANCAAKLKRRARIAFRVNPDVPADTHPYISTGLHKHKFGVPVDVATKLYREAARSRHLDVAGISCHIGSQITDVTSFAAAMERLAEMVRQLRAYGINIRYVDAGGGLGISYGSEESPDFATTVGSYSLAVAHPLSGLNVHLLLEPGRSVVAPAGALITRVLYPKSNNGKRFLVVDAAMNDLIRPSLYGAHHEIVPVRSQGGRKLLPHDVVGPICESGDFFAHDRDLPALESGELLAILDCGAYGMSLSSNYNTRSRAAEVLVDGRAARLVRRRESIADILRCES